MKATELLKSEHETLRRLVREYLSRPPSPASKRELFRAIRRELRTHSLDEERIFFPALLRSRSRAARQLVRSTLEWHHTLDELLARMANLDPEDARFEEMLAATCEKVEQHIEAESALTEASRHLSDRALEALGSQMLARPGRPAPPERS